MSVVLSEEVEVVRVAAVVVAGAVAALVVLALQLLHSLWQATVNHGATRVFLQWDDWNCLHLPACGTSSQRCAATVCECSSCGASSAAHTTSSAWPIARSRRGVRALAIVSPVLLAAHYSVRHWQLNGPPPPAGVYRSPSEPPVPLPVPSSCTHAHTHTRRVWYIVIDTFSSCVDEMRQVLSISLRLFLSRVPSPCLRQHSHHHALP